MVLRAYTFSDDICFAYLATDKHLMGDRADDAVGLFINAMLCRVQLHDSTTTLGVLKQLKNDFMSALPHQHLGLAKIAHARQTSVSQLFNTAMTLFAVDSGTAYSPHEIHLRQILLQDVNEVRFNSCYFSFFLAQT